MNMKANKNKFIFLIVGLIVIALILFFIKSGSSYESIDVSEVKELVSNEKVFVINTHTPYIGEIEGTDLIAENWNDMASYSNQLPKDKSTPILVYCRSGRMAETSASQLIELGYKKVYNLEGGMNSWQNEGNSLVN